jgi:hypothetical protein
VQSLSQDRGQLGDIIGPAASDPCKAVCPINYGTRFPQISRVKGHHTLLQPSVSYTISCGYFLSGRRSCQKIAAAFPQVLAVLDVCRIQSPSTPTACGDREASQSLHPSYPPPIFCVYHCSSLHNGAKFQASNSGVRQESANDSGVGGEL